MVQMYIHCIASPSVVLMYIHFIASPSVVLSPHVLLFSSLRAG